MRNYSQEERVQRRDFVFKQMKNLFQVDDVRGLEILGLLTRAVHLYEMIGSQQLDIAGLSMPRWGLLMHLFMAEQRGKPEGLTPTELSHFQQVSKNTISSLLRGLEEQGYIQREIDPKDLRVFRIHLSEDGRQLILKTAPHRIEMLNQMLSGLEDEDIIQLIRLMTKLLQSLEGQPCQAQKDLTCRNE